MVGVMPTTARTTAAKKNRRTEKMLAVLVTYDYLLFQRHPSNMTATYIYTDKNARTNAGFAFALFSSKTSSRSSESSVRR